MNSHLQIWHKDSAVDLAQMSLNQAQKKRDAVRVFIVVR